ncbi:MAG: 30S ribosomal protein S17 [Verrucomicrobia bacterium]|jgi:small subunit ribosomal protein S17|nr:30S ribosomal protein S17 [Verrucomicrobiota bacterium]
MAEETVQPEGTATAAQPEAAQAAATDASQQSEAPKRHLRKTRVGEVVSNKMDKTIVVAVVRRVPHPKFGKIIKRTKKFYAHDEQNRCAIGDLVRIEETRPLSRLKRWRLVEVLKH